MAQTFARHNHTHQRITAANISVTVPATGTTTLLTMVTEGVEKLSVQVDNTVQALDAFTITGRVHRDATAFTIASVAGDFSAPSGRLSNVSGALVTLAASASGRFDLDVSGLYEVTITASAAVDSAVVSIFAQGTTGGQAQANVTLTTGDLEIGAVELKNAADDTRAKVGVVSGLAASDNGFPTAALLLAGSALVGKVGVDQTTPGTTNAVSAQGGASYLNTAASVLVKTGAGNLTGIFVASASATPTIKLWDNTSAATTVLINTFTPAAGSWYPMPFKFGTGLYITISGTVDCTLSYS